MQMTIGKNTAKTRMIALLELFLSAAMETVHRLRSSDASLFVVVSALTNNEHEGNSKNVQHYSFPHTKTPLISQWKSACPLSIRVIRPLQFFSAQEMRVLGRCEAP
jgi:hypothetical protein